MLAAEMRMVTAIFAASGNVYYWDGFSISNTFSLLNEEGST
ncbi:MAG TPA: hypothetical protein VNF46_01670 [Gammaproteobacteria bacterium]|nr:hypothetical protein [Gammaproteobacteria bacterium]